jgi:hypothetical protein
MIPKSPRALVSFLDTTSRLRAPSSSIGSLALLFMALRTNPPDHFSVEDQLCQRLRVDQNIRISDVCITLTGNFSSSSSAAANENKDSTAIFSSHQFILVS